MPTWSGSRSKRYSCVSFEPSCTREEEVTYGQIPIDTDPVLKPARTCVAYRNGGNICSSWPNGHAASAYDSIEANY